MTVGKGKYDDALTQAREACGAYSALLIVLDGKQGPGFACQTRVTQLESLPAILRTVADQMEADFKRGVI